ncbi:hypothetical protein SISSUDRAFT_1049075 [Sistotremastrum suecicum HHB10207 ss-3]|uniref:Peptidase C14 caspase domain-containing protein n=1 Tax=Sistotremastrum suecicum HHB10207 ss-3 TaxID=1314776 RepID=A0A166C3M9_9AGAM|nr:hypothetical protein SISSUDRAFT_1049075 [Sistotremastrum suecicum HHB10207 ss-3]
MSNISLLLRTWMANLQTLSSPLLSAFYSAFRWIQCLTSNTFRRLQLLFATTFFARILGKPAPPRLKALIVSILYKGRPLAPCPYGGQPWDMELSGNHETAKALKDLLITKYQYSPNDITMMLDTETAKPCTRDNIIQGMQDLVFGARPGDRFVFFFAGHGGQKKAVKDTKEVDGMDEFIYPYDFRQDGDEILDDLINDLLVKPLPYGCQLTGIFDCCHSGTVMDLDHNFPSPGPSPGQGANSSRNSFLEDSQSHASAALSSATVTNLEQARGKLRKTPVRKPTLGLTATYTVDTLKSRGLPLNGGIQLKTTGQSEPPVNNVGVVSMQNDSPCAPALVTCWSACDDGQLVYENVRGEAAQKHLIQYIRDTDAPTYKGALLHLSEKLREDYEQRQKYNKGVDTDFESQRPQLGSSVLLNLESTFVL